MITKEYLAEHPDHIFVFGDNVCRRGLGGAATLRYEKNTYGFITKWAPNSKDKSFYRPSVYMPIYLNEIAKLKELIEANPNKTFLISKLGAGLANKYNIFEEVIGPRIKLDLEGFSNVKFLW